MNSNLVLGWGRNLKSKFLQRGNSMRIPQRNKIVNGIDIPSRIERGPLDILQALSGTVKTEPGMLNYKYLEDCPFQNNSLHHRRLISLAIDSGKKAAKWVVTENPTLFQHRVADPYIQAFAPPESYNAESEISENTLIDLIEDTNVVQAMNVYKLLKEKGIEVSQITKQNLLELTCYYNSSDREDHTLLETKYYENQKRIVTNTWNKGFADELFLEMEHDSKSYSALILGMLKHHNKKNGFLLYHEAKEKGIKFDVEVWNAVLENLSDEKYEFKDVETSIKDYLNKMAKENIEPNLGTLNAALKSVTAIRKWFKSRELAMSIYTEFTNIGIQPSLGTFYYILDIFFDRNKVHIVLEQILDLVEGKLWTLHHVDDLKFFSKAMEISSYNFNDFSLCVRINKILETGNNKIFLSGNTEEFKYYRGYLTAAFRYGSFAAGKQLYEDLVPHSFLPDAGFILVLIGMIVEKKEEQYIPWLWTAIKNANFQNSLKVLHKLITAVEENISKLPSGVGLQIATEIWEACLKCKAKESSLGEYISPYLRIFCSEKDQKLVFEVFDYIINFKIQYLEMDMEILSLFIDICAEAEDKDKALHCINLVKCVSDENMDTLIGKMESSFKLSSHEIDSLKTLAKSPKGEKEVDIY